MLLDGIPMFDQGLGMNVVCAAIGEVAKVGELDAPKNVRTVGGLIKALQKAYKPPVLDQTL